MLPVERNSGGGDRRYVVDAVLVVALISILGLIAVSVRGGPIDTADNTNNSNEDSMPSTMYNVTSNGVFPYEHTIRPGNKVGVYNAVDESITLYSESLDPRTVESGDYTVYRLDRITYFEANTTADRVGRLKVNVQRP